MEWNQVSMVSDQQVGPCPTRPMPSYATGSSSGWLSYANGIGAAQMISKEAEPQVGSAIVLHPGTQQFGFCFCCSRFTHLGINSLNFPSNPLLMLRLSALQTHDSRGMAEYCRRNCCNSRFHCPGWLCTPFRRSWHRAQRVWLPWQAETACLLSFEDI